MQYLTCDHPGERLQADMWVWPHTQAAAAFEHRRPGMVEKTPGADLAPLPRWHNPADGNATADFGAARTDALNGPVPLLVRAVQGV
ncbi:hypothetical protein D3C80_2081840 [compost metagenome]